MTGCRFKVKLVNFIGLTFSLWCITWLNYVIVVGHWLLVDKLVSNKPYFYHDIFFATEMRVSCKNVLSVLIGWSMLHLLATGDVSMSWQAICALCSDLPLLTTVSATVSRLELELRRTILFCCNFPCNSLVSVQAGLKRERTTNKIKCEWPQTATAKLFPSESHSTAY